MAIRFVPITLDKERRLRFDPNAIADLEGAMGSGVGEIFNERNFGIRAIRAMLWAGLKWEDRGLTLERAGAMIALAIENGSTLQEIATKITEGIQAAGWLSDGSEEGDQGNVAGA